MIDSTATISGRTMLANMLDAPVAELTVGDDIYAGEHLVDAGTLMPVSMKELVGGVFAYLVLLKAVLEDVLYDQAARLTQCNFVPHAS